MAYTKNNILIYSDKLAAFDYGETHPFKPYRAKLMFELLNRYGLIHEPDQEIVPPQALSEEALLSFHTKEYLNILKRCDAEEFDLDILEAGIGTEDNPVIPHMLEYAVTASGGTYQCAMKLLHEKVRLAFNPHGGFHHAGPGHAEGFCYINDIAIALLALVTAGKKVAYIDLDVHHGNGVQDAFYNDNRVLTISLHESGATLYPWGGHENEIGNGKGRGFNVNIPFCQGTDDDTYISTYEKIVPPLLKSFRPEILFVEIGGDAHRDDPLAHLQLTTKSYITILNSLRDMKRPMLATGGGGYSAHKTAVIWALSWATLCGLEATDNFAGLVGGMMYGPEIHSGSLEDQPHYQTGIKKIKCMEHADRVVSFIQNNIFPLHGIINNSGT